MERYKGKKKVVPTIVDEYNSHKYPVDIANEYLRSIEWAGKNNRWTVVFFLRFLFPAALLDAYKIFTRDFHADYTFEEYVLRIADYFQFLGIEQEEPIKIEAVKNGKNFEFIG